jgi:dTDP-4-amino-4,6-dideoxygalactose transaminase
LALRNIEARHIWNPLHKQPIFKQYDYFSTYDNEISCCEDIFNRGICLPSDTKMTNFELGRITEIIKEIFENQAGKGLRYAL